MVIDETLPKTEHCHHPQVDLCDNPSRIASRPAKILMVTPRYSPDTGGIETHVHEVSKRLVSAGNDVTVLTTDRNGGLPRLEQASGITVRRVRAWPRTKDFYLAPGIYSAVMNADCDIVHIQGYHTFVPPVAMLAAIRRGIPFLITFHSGGHSSRLRTLLRRTQWAALAPLVRRATRWIGVSKFEAELFTDSMGLPRDRVSVIRNGCEIPGGVISASASRRPLIVSMGRLEHYKGHHRVIEAFPLVLRRFPDARLRVLGEGPYKARLSALVARLGLADVVEIAGIPPAQRGELATLVGAASLVTLLSDYEAHPISAMEALALGCPVLVTDCTGFIELIDEGWVKAIALKASTADVSDAIIAQLAAPRGPIAVNLPSWSTCTDRLLHLYRTCGDPQDA
jgi:glycosyltransferase involved in cell wall biosynthesis